MKPEQLNDWVTLYEGGCPQQAVNKCRKQVASDLWEGRRAELTYLYHDLKWSQAKVATYFGVTQSGFAIVMKRLGITARNRANFGTRNGRFKDGSQSRLYRRVVVKDKCTLCGCADRLSVHHKNDNHYDNRPENLEVLCNSCHMSETKRKWWAAKKAGQPLPKSNGPVGWVCKKEVC